MQHTRKPSSRPIWRAVWLAGVVMCLALIAVPAAQANGVAFSQGDVLVSVGNGLIKHFDSSGNLLDTLDTTLGAGSYGGGMCFDSQRNLYATEFAAQTISKFDTNGNLVAASFGSGFNSDPESCSLNAADQLFVGQADGSHQVLKFDTSGNPLGTFSPAIESRGTDWVDLAKDGCTLQYTSEGNAVHQFDVCTSNQLPDFATGLPGPCFANRILTDGTVLVACSSVVEHLNSAGSIINTYNEPSGGGGALFALSLDPDGTSFWTADLNTGQIWRIDIATGNVITTFNANSPSAFVAGLAIVGEITPSLATRAPTVLSTSAPTVASSTGAAFSGSVNPEGLPTTAYFQYGLDARYRSAGGGIVYDHSTPAQQVGSGYSNDPASASVSGLLPNALYHVRLVATNSDGTAFGADQTFTTKQDPPPPPPVLGKQVNVTPVSGLVFVKFPGSHSAADHFGANALSKGQGFIPLTEARQLPTGSQIDARQGTLKLITATAKHGKTQSGVFSSGLFKLTQQRSGLNKGLTTLSLLEGAFPGAPSFSVCKGHAATDTTSGPTAQTARLNRRILNTLHSRDNHGSFRTKGHYSAATVRGTAWDTIDRCDGTLTIVHRGTVLVTDFVRRKTIAVHARHSYLARAITRRRK